MVTKFSGSMDEWKSYLNEAMNSGKLSADAAFSFIENESGQMSLKLIGNADEWARYMEDSGRLSQAAYTTAFREIGAAGEMTFGALTAEAQAFQATLNSIQAPHINMSSPVFDSTPSPSFGASMDGFATGGSFIVGGSGGTDSTQVGFMATPGEKVTVETPAQQRSGGEQAPIIINIEGDSAGLEHFIRVTADDHRVQVNRSEIRSTERVY
jgi:hypothetical protein